MAATYQVLLNNVDVTQYIDQENFQVQQEYGRTGSTATIFLEDNHTYPEVYNVIPKALQTIEVTDTSISEVIFAGQITNPNMYWLSPNINQWQMEAVDYTTYTNAAVVSGTWISTPINEIIQDLLVQANCGITGNHVQPGPVVPNITLRYESLTNALVKLSKLAIGGATQTVNYSGSSSQPIEFGWFIDSNLDLWWFNAATAPSSGVMFTDVYKGASTASLGYYTRDQLQYEWDGSQFRTAVFVRGGKLSGGNTDGFLADGYTTAWPLTYQYDPSLNGTLVLTVGGVQQTVAEYEYQAAQGVLSTHSPGVTSAVAPPTTDYILSQNASGQWFLQVALAATPTAGQQISITYTYSGTITARADDFATQQQYSGPNGGIYMEVVNDSTAIDFATAMQRAQGELGLYSGVQERVTFYTDESWPGHINAGYTFVFHSSVIPDASNNYAVGNLQATYLVERNSILSKPGNLRQYEITGVRIS